MPKLYGASTNSAVSLERAREWYEYCRNFHPECTGKSEGELPTRLLHYKDGHLRLRNGADVDNSTKYATLSHCWGKFPMLKLTMENMQSFETEIEITKLSRTFQDAFQILTHLGLEFLWIDSLCIVQDDPDDWNRESLLMSSVYGCGDITIAAASSTDGNQGCFYERKMPMEHLLHIDIASTHQNSEDIQNRDFNSYTISHPPHPKHEWEDPCTLINQSTLFKRGWVCQERNLTPRLLVFNSSYLYWECAEWSEPEWKTPITKGSKDVQDRHDRVGQDFSWRRIVKAISSSILTYPTDRLVSTSGITKKIQSIFPDEYYAGMWRKDFERQLCWSTAKPERASSSEYLAPS